MEKTLRNVNYSGKRSPTIQKQCDIGQNTVL